MSGRWGTVCTLDRARDALVSSPGHVSGYPRLHVGPVKALNRVPAAIAARSVSGASGGTAVVRTIRWGCTDWMNSKVPLYSNGDQFFWSSWVQSTQGARPTRPT